MWKIFWQYFQILGHILPSDMHAWNTYGLMAYYVPLKKHQLNPFINIYDKYNWYCQTFVGRAS